MKKLSVMVAVAALVALTLSGCGGKTISTAGMVDVEFSGVSPYATASKLEINADKFSKAAEAAGLTQKEIKELYGTFKVVPSKQENIMNNDVITLTINYDKNLTERYKLKIETPSEDITASNLREMVCTPEQLTDEIITEMNKIVSDKRADRWGNDNWKDNPSVDTFYFADKDHNGEPRNGIVYAFRKNAKFVSGEIIIVEFPSLGTDGFSYDTVNGMLFSAEDLAHYQNSPSYVKLPIEYKY